MSSVDLLDGVSVDDHSDGLVINLERKDFMLTIAVSIDNSEGDLGRGICAGEICGTT
jgi:hypothetical protein